MFTYLATINPKKKNFEAPKMLVNIAVGESEIEENSDD